MYKYRDRIIRLGKETGAQIVLPEMTDTRVREAAKELTSIGFEVLKIEDYQDNIDLYLDHLSTLPFTDNWPAHNLREFLNDPLQFAMAMVACDDADCLVAGAVTSSSDVIRSAIRMIGIRPSSNQVSSIFLMLSPDGDNAFTFADCAVVPEPDSKQLASIAAESAEFHHFLTGEEPVVAFLSFSTKGSASHYRVDRVRDAVEIFGKKHPQIIHDGEVQVDAAINPEVNKSKIPNSPINGDANVLVFPNLDAGNIAYKITQRLGGYSAWGPLLQGLNKPVHDLSRGCSVNDIMNVSAIAALQRNMYANV
ncbi:MAG: phosphate acetyltransferase [Candidatus Marinimicrobia bacterium]|nr:phosphate acetyltransferase [Candidatus Neomarinimicrobiota bacterium]